MRTIEASVNLVAAKFGLALEKRGLLRGLRKFQMSGGATLSCESLSGFPVPT